MSGVGTVHIHDTKRNTLLYIIEKARNRWLRVVDASLVNGKDIHFMGTKRFILIMNTL